MFHKLKKLFLTALLIASVLPAWAVYVTSMPAIRIQPNGDTLHCFVTGDEFYHRMHDAAGYTIVQDPESGYYVYAVRLQDSTLAPSSYIAGIDNPANLGVQPGLTISHKEMKQRYQAWEVPEEYRQSLPRKTSGRNHGTMNNIVIFIRFYGDNEINQTFSSINAKYNDSTEDGVSLYNYFKHVSLGKIHIPTHYYPTPNGNHVVSYEDIHPRGYYIPYNRHTNPDGYGQDRASREFGLIERAIQYVNDSCPIPDDIDLDMDGDGMVDNISFILKGTYTGWSDLLWPHKWNLYDREVYINGKRVSTFNLLLEGAGDDYFNTSTFCHEMFHSLGAPDLYRYYTYTSVSPVASWDLMGSNSKPPQHMSAYMKYKYGNWMDSIPTITKPGIYSIHSAASDDYSNICYKVASSDPNQFYMIEYRDDHELFETGIPGTGLLVYRIDTRYDGNAGYNDYSTFDEVWLYRPGGSAHDNGNPSQAYMRTGSGRTSFFYGTNPHPWLTDGSVDSTFAIFDISEAGETISFVYDNLSGCDIPHDLASDSITGISAQLSWKCGTNQFVIEYYPTNSPADLHRIVVNDTNDSDLHTFQLENLETFTNYTWQVRSLCSATDSSVASRARTFHTQACYEPIIGGIFNTSGGYSGTTTPSLPFPVFAAYSYTQQIYRASEMDTARTITSFAFNYSTEEALTQKNLCDVYMAHTKKDRFLSANDSSYVPFDSLTLVYSGPLNCHKGWTTFNMQTPFEYNGVDNVVLAILDRSGASEHQSYTFYSATDSLNMAVTRFHRTDPVDPVVSTDYEDRNLLKRRPLVRFYGCFEHIYVISASVDWIDTMQHRGNQAQVIGSGLYLWDRTVNLTAIPLDENCSFVRWNDGVANNPRQVVVAGDRHYTAYFRETVPVGIHTNEAPACAIIGVSHNRMTVSGVEGKMVRVFDIMGRLIAQQKDNHTFFLPHPGIYLVQVDTLPAKKVSVMW